LNDMLKQLGSATLPTATAPQDQPCDN